MRLLEEFWYGNIEPTEYDTNACKEYKEVLRLITRNEEKLLATMTDDQKELFSRYTDAVREYHTIAEYLLFQNRFASHQDYARSHGRINDDQPISRTLLG